mgnify:CR=1 FL=1
MISCYKGILFCCAISLIQGFFALWHTSRFYLKDWLARSTLKNIVLKMEGIFLWRNPFTVIRWFSNRAGTSLDDDLVGSISAALSIPRASPRRDFSGISAGSFPETAADNRAYACSSNSQCGQFRTASRLFREPSHRHQISPSCCKITLIPHSGDNLAPSWRPLILFFFLKRTSFYALTSKNNSIDQELLYGFLHTFLS